MKTSGSPESLGSRWLVVAVAVSVGYACGGTEGTQTLDSATHYDPADAGAEHDAGTDAGSCPKPDGGRIQVTRRGCPTTLEIGIQ